MKHEVIIELARTFLDTTVTVYFANEYIKGWWFSIDTDTNIMCLIRLDGVQRREGKHCLYIDIDTIVAIEVTEDE